jgi:hypothetical protein
MQKYLFIKTTDEINLKGSFFHLFFNIKKFSIIKILLYRDFLL